MANRKQITKEIKKELDQFNFEKAIEMCDNEAQTRMYLIEPFFEILRFNRGLMQGDLHPEYTADFGNNVSKKVDYAIILKGDSPTIVIECKKASKTLNDKDIRQLNEYFMYTKESKIGILTNGVQYMFFTRSSTDSSLLNHKPFFVFDLNDYDSSSIETLALFYRTSIELNAIIEEAEEIYFLDQFEDAFYKELSHPSKEFIKAIYSNMGGKRMTDKTESQIRPLINSVSIKTVLDRIIVDEANSTNSGIITTDEELRIYHVVKTILAQNKKIETHRIGYRDMKGKFSILMDDNQRLKICDIYATPNSQRIDINGEKFEVSDFDSIVKLKKKLTDSALELLD
jgi:hypothetical protein